MVAELILVTAGSNVQDGKASAQQVAGSLVSAGIRVRETITICSNVPQLQQAISSALGRSHVLILLGGLGHASEYMTKQVLSEGLGLSLQTDIECLQSIRSFCRRTGEPFEEIDSQLAHLPQGSTPFLAKHGKIPGFGISSAKQHIFALPETPKEAAAMCHRSVIPLLSQPVDTSVTVSRMVRTFGLSESAVREKLASLSRSENPSVQISRENNDVLIQVTATASSNQQAAALCTPLLRTIVAQMGDAAYGLDVESLEEAVVDKLQKKSFDLAIAEVGTSDMLTRLIREIDGGQDVLRYSLSSDDNDIHKLGIKPRKLKKHGPVSEYAAVHMAHAVREIANSTLGVAICANPDGSLGKKVPRRFVYIAVCDADNVYVKKLVIGEDNNAAYDAVIDASLSRTLNMVRLFVDYLPDRYPAAIPLDEALAGKTVTDCERYEDVFATSDPPQSQTTSFGKRVKNNFTTGKADGAKQKVRKLIFTLAMLIFIASAGYIGYYYLNSFINRHLNANLQNMFAFGDMEGIEISPDFPLRYNRKFAGLWTINPDVVAFVGIEDTAVQYPIVQSTDNDYYLRRDFYGKNNQYGVPFMDFRVNVKKPSDNMVVYGHNMRDGTIFGDLIKYKDVEFYRQHPIVDLSTLYDDAQYKIFSIFISNAYENQGPVFNYHDFIDAQSKEEFLNYIEQLRVRSLINTTVDVNEKDELLTLSTCTYEFKDARFVVVARKVRWGEDTAVDTDGATQNPQPLMPDIWYKTFGGTKPEGLALATVRRPITVQTSGFKSASIKNSTSSLAQSSHNLSEAETSRLASEAEASRLASEAEASRLASEAEASRLASEAEASRLASEAEASRLASEAEASRLASEAEASRLASEAEASRLASEAEVSRLEEERRLAEQSRLEEERRLEEEANRSSNDTLAVYANGRYIEEDALEIISRVVQSEVGPSFETEAIKAQALAAYSFILHSNQSGTTPSVVMASDADSKVRKAVSSVMGEGIYYNNKIAFTPYHATSSGATTSSAAVWGGNYPYLVSVDSSVDKKARNFKVSTTISRSKVESLLDSKLNIQTEGDPEDWFEILSYEDGDYVGQISICGIKRSPNTGISITGRMLRESIFSLRSAKFTIDYNENRDAFIFTTYGYGHGVGMSQTGANLYAQQGWSYIDILEHYYPGTSIQ